LAASKLSLKNTPISPYFKMFFLSFAPYLNKIYLATSKLKIAATTYTTYNFFQNDSFSGYYFLHHYYNNHNPQGLYMNISPPGLFKSFSKKIIISSFISSRLSLNLFKACKF
jgi:hypothetical protein